MKNKTVLITGSEGFIGSHLVKSLREKTDIDIISVDYKLGHQLLDKNSVKDLPDADCIIHLAAKMSIPSAWEDPYSMYNININTTLNMLEFARERGVKKFIFPSTYIYGNPQYLPVDENHPVNASNPYTRSKLLGEELCKSYSEDYDIPVIILRLFNVYGPAQSNIALIPTIISQLPNHKIILKDSTPRRDYVYISDVVRAIQLALDFPVLKREVFNIGSGVSYQVSEVVDLILRISNIKCDVIYSNKPRKNEIPEVLADISKAGKLLKWEPAVSLEKGLKKMLSND